MFYKEKVLNCTDEEETIKVKAKGRLILKAFEFFLDCNKSG